MGRSRKLAAIPNGPAFSAYAGATTSIASTGTKVQFNTEEFDTASCYDTTTSRFTPNVAGYYQINASVQLFDTSVTNSSISITKNGTTSKLGNYTPSAQDYPVVQASVMIYMNGTTDYVEVFAGHAKVSAINASASQSNTWFQAALVRVA